MTNQKELIESLFETKALEICEAGKPFFYTSGKLGPYYINTHYLYGSKGAAEAFLKMMEANMFDISALPAKLLSVALIQYNSNKIYRNTIDQLVNKCSKMNFDFVSGGERRDFFFSIPVAFLLKKPHLSIFKDGSVIYSTDDFEKGLTEGEFSIRNSICLHVADLVTVASSYVRSWIPAIKRLGAIMKYSVSVIDRKQGGTDLLRQHGIDYSALVEISDNLFYDALKSGYISHNQLDLILAFSKDPDQFVVDFCKSNPNFLNEQIALGGKAKERAMLCINSGFNISGANK